MSEPGTDGAHHLPDPQAAERYDGSECCDYEECRNPADFRVQIGYKPDNRYLMLCCKPCSEKNRIYAEKNQLLENEVRASE